MSTDLSKLRLLLKDTGYSVFRDKAPANTPYPYIVYSFVSEDIKRASSRPFKYLPLYQVSLFTTGTERDFKNILNKLNVNGIPTSSVMSIIGDENDDTVTNFFVNVRTVENVE